MKHFKLPATLLLSAMLFFTIGCDKSSDQPSSKTLLTKITVEQEGETGMAEFEYDSQKRVSKMKGIEEGVDFEIQYLYFGDTLIQALEFEDGVESFRTDYLWHADAISQTWYSKGETGLWVDQGFMKVYYVSGNGGNTISNLSNGKNNITHSNWLQKIDEYSWGAAGIDEKYTWNNGNIDKVESWVESNIKKGIILPLNQRFSNRFLIHELKSARNAQYSYSVYEYDDSPNVFSSLGLVYNLGGLNKNNITLNTLTVPNTDEPEMKIRYNYEYNEQNYPIKLTVSLYNDGDWDDLQVMYFEYNIQ